MNQATLRKLNLLLDQAIMIVMLLNGKQTLDRETGLAYEKTLKGLRKRINDPSYMNMAPQGPDVDRIDELIIPLVEDKLISATTNSHLNVLYYSIKTIIYGIGVGHKILTPEEKEMETFIVVGRRMTVEQYINLLEECEKCDRELEKFSKIESRIRKLKIANNNAQKASEDLVYKDPGLLKEIELFWDVSEMTDNAAKYLDLRSSISKNEREIEDLSKDIDVLSSGCKIMQDRIYFLYEEIRNNKLKNQPAPKKKGLFGGFGKKKQVEEEAPRPVLPGGPEVSESLLDEQSTEDDWSMEKLMSIYDKITKGEEPDLIDARYAAMEELMNSDQIKGYVSQAYQEYMKYEDAIKAKRDELS